jgi:hypothetical protein
VSNRSEIALLPVDILAMKKCLAAEVSLVYPGDVPKGRYKVLEAQGLVGWRNGWRLTKAGESALAEACEMPLTRNWKGRLLER